MNLSEINSYIELGAQRSVCIDCTLDHVFSGRVREITICADNLVKVSYNAYGSDEGGLEFHLSYASQAELVASLERFLDKPLSEWENFSKSGRYPESPKVHQSVDQARAELLDALRKGSIDLPIGWQSSKVHPHYWEDAVNPK